jgi:hypothetical protein
MLADTSVILGLPFSFSKQQPHALLLNMPLREESECDDNDGDSNTQRSQADPVRKICCGKPSGYGHSEEKS